MALNRKRKLVEAKGASFSTTLFYVYRRPWRPSQKLAACIKRNKVLLGFYTTKHFGGYKAKVKVIWRRHNVSTIRTYVVQILRGFTCRFKREGKQGVKQSWLFLLLNCRGKRGFLSTTTNTVINRCLMRATKSFLGAARICFK